MNVLSRAFLFSAALSPLLAGCSTVRRTAVNQLGNALAGSGTVFASDNDPELIRDAAPFSLKLMESLLEQTPQHRGLLLAAAKGFTQYAFAFVQQDADFLEDSDFSGAEAERSRAARLYLRARDYGLRGLEVSHPGFQYLLRQDATAAMAGMEVDDVPFLYWTAAAWAGAVALSKDDPYLVGDLPYIQALIDRALALDESFNRGAIHGFLISYEMSRPGAAGDPAERARVHFDRAVELSGGHLAGPYVAFAESVLVPHQDLAGFRRLLTQALAVDPDDQPEDRLANLIYQRRARWLLEHEDDLFLIP